MVAYDAAANGFQLLPGGTQSVARGGAVAARPSDPMVLLHNPAGLTELGGDQILLNFDVAFHAMCVDPYGYYGWGVYQPGASEFGDPLELDDPSAPTVGATYASSPLEKVCNSAQAIGLPQLAWTHRINRDWAIGAGFVSPTSVGGVQYGGEDGTVATQFGPRPTPTRYTVIKQELLFALNPTFGAAYRIIPRLSVGATFQVLMVKARSIAVQNFATGTQPSTDWLTTAEIEDYFIPGFVLSVNAEPIDTIDLMAAFHWVDDLSGPGKVTIETNTFHQGATVGPKPFENQPIELSNVTARLPWNVTVGARYAAPLPNTRGATGLGDPMDTELWDVEVDASYAFTARTGSGTIEAADDITVATARLDDGEERVDSVTVAQEDLANFEVDRHLKDSLAMRLGGSFAILPRQLMAQGGVFYETRGVEPAYADIDTFAFRRFGFGLGLVLRIGSFDLGAGYSHIFSETLEVAPPPHANVEDATPGVRQSGFDQRIGGTFDEQEKVRLGGVVYPDPDAPSPKDADAVARKTQRAAVSTAVRPNRVVNAGKYTAAFNVVSVGVVYHF